MDNQRRSVLMIDDEREFCILIKMHLEGISNLEVFCAYSGREGLRLCRELKPDIILLDISMPEMSGFEVLEKLKKDPVTVKVPVIMLTAKSDNRSKARAAQLYDEYYITKPVDTKVLKEKIENALSRREGRAA